jgi:D-tyrosyl-tRNA(Tyr) deacylase
MGPDEAEGVYEEFVEALREVVEPQGGRVATGQFQAMMEVELVNDGPVTILLDSRKTF